MLRIRLAESPDISEVCRIVNQLTPGTPHDYRDAIGKFERSIQSSPDYFLWVADLNGEIVGTGMMHLQHKISYHCGTAAHLEDVVVDKDHRGQGIGEALVQMAINTARKHNCYKVILGCFDKTAPYYERFGFKQHDIGMRLDLIQNLYPS